MIYLFLTAGVFLLDFIIKRLADKALEEHVQRPCLCNKLILEKYYNRGAAFGLLRRHPKLLRGLQAAMALAVGIAYGLLLRLPGKQLAKTGVALLAGGGASNLYDRFTRGHVVDYFHLNIGPKRFRRIVYNISDFCIFIGSVLTAFGADE